VRLCLLLAAAGLVCAQSKPPKPFHSDASSAIDYGSAADGSETVVIQNVSYEVSGTGVVGRPADERLLLRKTIRSREVLGDIGVEASVTLDAWRFGDDLSQKPLYTFTVEGTDGHTMDNALFVAARGLEEVEWWSVYRLGSGQHLFDTDVPLVSFSISRETVKTRYVGFAASPDDSTDARLKQPNVVGVITYAAGDRVVREALITCDDPNQAALLRSYADAKRTLAAADHTLKLSFSRNYPSPANAVEVRIPLRGDDLDLAHAQLAPKLHITAWRR